MLMNYGHGYSSSDSFPATAILTGSGSYDRTGTAWHQRPSHQQQSWASSPPHHQQHHNNPTTPLHQHPQRTLPAASHSIQQQRPHPALPPLQRQSYSMENLHSHFPRIIVNSSNNNSRRPHHHHLADPAPAAAAYSSTSSSSTLSSSKSVMSSTQYHVSSTTSLDQQQQQNASSATGSQLLRRTPSLTGAQRKIRQRREEKLLQSSKLYVASLAKTTENKLGTSCNDMLAPERSTNGASSSMQQQQFQQTTSLPLSGSYTNISSTTSNHKPAPPKPVDDLLEYRNLINKIGYQPIPFDDRDTSTTKFSSAPNPSLNQSMPTNDVFTTRFQPEGSLKALKSEKPTRPPRASEASVSSKSSFAPKKTSNNENGFSIDQNEFRLKNSNQLTNDMPKTGLTGHVSFHAQPQKPTIQVHPLPPPRHNSLGGSCSSSSSDSPPNTLIKKPPPIPKKPSLDIERQFCSLDDPTPGFALNDFSKESPSNERRELPLKLSGKSALEHPVSDVNSSRFVRSKESLYLNPIEKSKSVDNCTYFSSSSVLSAVPTESALKSQKVSSIPYASNKNHQNFPNKMKDAPLAKKESKTFCATPLTIRLPPLLSQMNLPSSLSSLQNSLNHAVDFPDQYTKEQLLELEERRLQSIESLSKKIAERELDRAAVCEEINAILHVPEQIYAKISSFMLAKQVELHITQMEQLAELSYYLQSQVEKLEQSSLNGSFMSDIDRELIEWRRLRVMQQVNDLQNVQDSFEERGKNLNERICIEVQDRELLLEWKFFKDMLWKLVTERRQIDEKVQCVISQLGALKSTIAIVGESTKS